MKVKLAGLSQVYDARRFLPLNDFFGNPKSSYRDYVAKYQK